MNWREIDWDIVTLGRVVGIAIIIVGIVLAALNANAGTDYGQGSHYKLRAFFHGVVDYLWRGGLIIVAAEVAERIGWGRGDEQDVADENLSTS